jgi:hypothetical protein
MGWLGASLCPVWNILEISVLASLLGAAKHITFGITKRAAFNIPKSYSTWFHSLFFKQQEAVSKGQLSIVFSQSINH